MKLEFKVYQLKSDSKMYKKMVEDVNGLNEFIIVGEEKLNEEFDCYKVQQNDERGICLIDGIMFDEFSFLIKKDELELKGDIGCEILELDIPKKYLTMDAIENIQRLNS
jgi:hypothetical protein